MSEISQETIDETTIQKRGSASQAESSEQTEENLKKRRTEVDIHQQQQQHNHIANQEKTLKEGMAKKCESSLVNVAADSDSSKQLTNGNHNVSGGNQLRLAAQLKLKFIEILPTVLNDIRAKVTKYTETPEIDGGDSETGDEAQKKLLFRLLLILDVKEAGRCMMNMSLESIYYTLEEMPLHMVIAQSECSSLVEQNLSYDSQCLCLIRKICQHAPPEFMLIRAGSHKTLLHLALLSRKPCVAEYLISQGAPISHRDAKGTALEYAIVLGAPYNLMKRLIENGGSVHYFHYELGRAAMTDEFQYDEYGHVIKELHQEPLDENTKATLKLVEGLYLRLWDGMNNFIETTLAMKYNILDRSVIVTFPRSRLFLADSIQVVEFRITKKMTELDMGPSDKFILAMMPLNFNNATLTTEAATDIKQQDIRLSICDYLCVHAFGDYFYDVTEAVQVRKQYLKECRLVAKPSAYKLKLRFVSDKPVTYVACQLFHCKKLHSRQRSAFGVVNPSVCVPQEFSLPPFCTKENFEVLHPNIPFARSNDLYKTLPHYSGNKGYRTVVEELLNRPKPDTSPDAPDVAQKHEGRGRRSKRTRV